MRQNTEQEKLGWEQVLISDDLLKVILVLLFICPSSEENKEGSFLIYSGTENLKCLINL